MDVSFSRIEARHYGEVRTFLLAEPWPFHAGGRLPAAELDVRLASGWLDGPGTESFWIGAQAEHLGLLRLFDLDEGAPLFDLRLAAAARNRGVGTAAVQWLASHVFGARPEVDRIEATTRVDNVAMRRVLERCGWAKESHWRDAWPAPDGSLHDGVGYALLRRDHERGSVTPVRWDD